MKGNEYYLLEGSDEVFHLAPTTFGRYEELKMAQYGCTAFPEDLKESIRQEFNFEKSDDEEKYGLAEMYRRYIEILFLVPPKNYKMKDVDLSVVNKAAQDFFDAVAGS